MRLGLQAPMEADWRQTIEKVRIAEDLGIDPISAGGESWGLSTIPWLTVLAVNTSKARLLPSILNVFSRTPAALAQEFALLDQFSEGRMVLGLGSSGHLVIEHFHGIPFEKPLRRIREYVEIFEMLVTGVPLNYDGELFHLQRGFRLRDYEPRRRIPVWIAAITPRSIRQTAEIADGIMPIHWPTRLLPQLREQLAEAARGAGRDPSAFTLAPFTNAFVLDGRDDDRRWHEARAHLHRYVNRMGDFYWQMLSRNGFEAEVAASRAAWAQRDADGSMAALSDAMVRSIQVIGPLEHVREELRERARLGADVQLLYMPPGEPTEVGARLEALLR
jgi:alkanesulfonate monooxygenase SsuD/methylene tetrahydromethanopterin reductase-like flavin-dependent oxidoreductase (luciferase family)